MMAVDSIGVNVDKAKMQAAIDHAKRVVDCDCGQCHLGLLWAVLSKAIEIAVAKAIDSIIAGEFDDVLK